MLLNCFDRQKSPNGPKRKSSRNPRISFLLRFRQTISAFVADALQHAFNTSQQIWGAPMTRRKLLAFICRRPIPGGAPPQLQAKNQQKCKAPSETKLFKAETCWADPILAESVKKTTWTKLRRDRPSPARSLPRCHQIQSRNQFCASVIIQHIVALRLRNFLPNC